MKKLFTILTVFALCAGMVFGLQENQKQKEEMQLKQQLESRKLRTEIVTVKYINANWAMGLLRHYVSRYGKIQNMPRSNKIIIEDTPEIVEKILTILNELDVRPLDMQFSVDLILGTADSGAAEDLSKDLKADPVIKELRSLMKYRSFRALDSSIIKVQDNSRSYQRIGGNGMDLKLQLSPRYIQEQKGDSFQVELRLSKVQGIDKEGKEVSTTLIDTTLSLKSGERTVVGVSKLDGGDKALILILSGKVLK